MGERTTLPKNWKELLREEADADKRTELEGRVAQLSAIPLGVKTPYTLYLEARYLESMKAVADLRNVSIQSLFREGVESVLDKYVDRPAKRKRAQKKKRG